MPTLPYSMVPDPKMRELYEELDRLRMERKSPDYEGQYGLSSDELQGSPEDIKRAMDAKGLSAKQATGSVKKKALPTVGQAAKALKKQEPQGQINAVPVGGGQMAAGGGGTVPFSAQNLGEMQGGGVTNPELRKKLEEYLGQRLQERAQYASPEAQRQRLGDLDRQRENLALSGWAKGAGMMARPLDKISYSEYAKGIDELDEQARGIYGAEQKLKAPQEMSDEAGLYRGIVSDESNQRFRDLQLALTARGQDIKQAQQPQPRGALTEYQKEQLRRQEEEDARKKGLAAGELEIPGYRRDTSITPQKQDVTKLRDAVGVLDAFDRSTDLLISDIQKHGSFENPLTDKGSEMKASIENLMMQIKELYGLGALQAHEVVRLQAQLPSTTDPTEIFRSSSNSMTKLKTLKRSLRQVVESRLGARGYSKAQAAPPGGGDIAKPRKLYSPSRNKTRIIYPDGREEIVDGKQ